MNVTTPRTLIVGQGICGTLLSWELYRAGKPFRVVDDAAPFASGRVASGLINPVTGMRLAKAWNIDELLPAAIATYRALEGFLNTPLLAAMPLIEFFPTAEHAQLFARRAVQYPDYLHPITDSSLYAPHFNSPYGAGQIDCYLLAIGDLLRAWQQWLITGELLLSQQFQWAALQRHNGRYIYEGAEYDYVVSCEGAGVLRNPWFAALPWAFNKGQALIADIPGLSRETLYHNGLKITPWGNGQFWIGSSFEWIWTDEAPSMQYREQTEARLKEWLRLPYTITDQLASIRPATTHRMPVCAWHATEPRLGILNGMGAKGCSQAPMLAAIPMHKVLTCGLINCMVS